MGFFTTKDCSVYRRWVNLIPAALISGGAHFLAGRIKAGVIWFLFIHCVVFANGFLLVAPLNKSFSLYQAASIFYLVAWIVMMVDACRTPIPRLKKAFWILYVFIAVSITLVPFVIVRQFLFQPFRIPTGTMQPTLMGDKITHFGVEKTGDQIIVSKMAYWFHEPQRGDIVVFSTDGIGQFQIPAGEEYVKRVVGIPGDTVSIHEPYALINGKRLDTPDIFKKLASGTNDYWGYTTAYLLASDKDKIVLGKDEYLVLGDNSQNSLDGRYYGPIKRGSIIGKVVLIFMPFDRKGSPE